MCESRRSAVAGYRVQDQLRDTIEQKLLADPKADGVPMFPDSPAVAPRLNVERDVTTLAEGPSGFDSALR